MEYETTRVNRVSSSHRFAPETIERVVHHRHDSPGLKAVHDAGRDQCNVMYVEQTCGGGKQQKGLTLPRTMKRSLLPCFPVPAGAPIIAVKPTFITANISK